MTTRVSIVAPLPGVGMRVGSVALVSTDPARRLWEASVAVNLEEYGLADADYALGTYRTGLAASVRFERGERTHLVWDCLALALEGDEHAALCELLEEAFPGSVAQILDAIAVEESDFYGQGIDAPTDRVGLHQQRRDYGESNWSW